MEQEAGGRGTRWLFGIQFTRNFCKYIVEVLNLYLPRLANTIALMRLIVCVFSWLLNRDWPYPDGFVCQKISRPHSHHGNVLSDSFRSKLELMQIVQNEIFPRSMQARIITIHETHLSHTRGIDGTLPRILRRHLRLRHRAGVRAAAAFARAAAATSGFPYPQNPSLNPLALLLSERYLRPP